MECIVTGCADCVLCYIDEYGAWCSLDSEIDTDDSRIYKKQVPGSCPLRINNLTIKLKR